MAADAPVEIDGWRVSLAGVERGGKLTRLTGGQAIIAHSIAAAKGEIVHSSALAERIDYNGDNNVVQVMLARVRQRVRGIPIETCWGQGYRWKSAA